MKKRKTIIRSLCALLAAFSVFALSAVGYETLQIPSVLPYESAYQIGRSPLLSFVGKREGSGDNSDDGSNRTLMLCGVLPVKNVRVTANDAKTVTLCGHPFGCIVNIENVLVVGFTDVKSNGKTVNPAQKSGVRTNDRITAIDGKSVDEVSDISKQLKRANGEAMSVTVLRDGKEKHLQITPAFSDDEQAYKLGIWVRDSEAGIGILSFYDSETQLAVGLGHAIKDADTGAAFSDDGGDAYQAKVLSVEKGKNGNPGQLSGCIQSAFSLGKIVENNNLGIFVKTEDLAGESIAVAVRDEIETGLAYLYFSLGKEDACEYEVNIEKVREDSNNHKNLVVRVNDSDLIELTGGIVQGMSGTPILQNGKLIGVITHVLIDDPTVGYGVFAEDLLQHAKEIG